MLGWLQQQQRYIKLSQLIEESQSTEVQLGSDYMQVLLVWQPEAGLNEHSHINTHTILGLQIKHM